MLLWWPRPWDQICQGPWEKPNTSFLLKEYHNDMTPYDILLYSQRHALLSYHQRNLLLQQVEQIWRPTAGQSAEWEALGHSARKGISPLNPLSQGSGNFAEEEAGRAQGMETQRSQDRLPNSGLAHTWTQRMRQPPWVCTWWGPWVERWCGHMLLSITQKLYPNVSHLQTENWYSLRKSHWRKKPLLSVAPRPSRRWPMQNELKDIFGGFSSHNVKSENSF